MFSIIIIITVHLITNGYYLENNKIDQNHCENMQIIIFIFKIYFDISKQILKQIFNFEKHISLA